MIDELSIIRSIRERFKRVSKCISLGIGDDAAAVRINPECLLLVTTDSHVEGVHFLKGVISAEDIGRRAVAVSVSDIGAMGGIPRFFLSSLGFPRQEDEGFLKGIMDGFKRAEDEFNLALIGGNLSASEKLFLDITVLGEVEPHIMVKRTGARPGDIIYVSGTVGDSALGLRILKRGEKNEREGYLVSRHVSPQPRLSLGREIARMGLPTSMIDISDGLILDLERITVEHGLGADIYVEHIPLSPNYKNRISDFVQDPYELALSGGEDYELLFTSPEEKGEEIKGVSMKLDMKITEIGRVTDRPLLRVLDSDGRDIGGKHRGFIHFSA
ncbi:MAG: thiamine-phosphate kinase [Candidatus Dadabacteria bacterium]